MSTPNTENSANVPAVKPRKKSPLLSVLGAVAALVGGGGSTVFARAQLEHNTASDARMAAVEQQVATLREHSAAMQANIEWLVRIHGGQPVAGAGAGTASPRPDAGGSASAPLAGPSIP